jgi:hypothetical protein
VNDLIVIVIAPRMIADIWVSKRTGGIGEFVVVVVVVVVVAGISCWEMEFPFPRPLKQNRFCHEMEISSDPRMRL